MNLAPGAAAEPIAHDPVGKKFQFSADALPQPGATRSVANFPAPSDKPAGVDLAVPEGFEISVFAEGGFGQVRNIIAAPNGDFFAMDSRKRELVVLRDADGDGVAETREVFVKGLIRPFGIAIGHGYVYVGNTSSVVRYKYADGQMKAEGAGETIVDTLPAGGRNNHWTRNLMFRPDGEKLFISVGSASNVGEEPPFRATILECNPDGSDLRIFGSGLRNPIGLAWNEATGELWTAVNERDQIGDDLVPDYTTSVRDGGFYGWPYFYIGKNYDERLRGKGKDRADDVIIPDVLFESHSASLGIAFYDGEMFPEEYQGDLFVAMHGSWNRSKRTGYKIVRVRMKDGKPVGGYENFMTGWLPDPLASEVWGRPVMVHVAPDGALLVVDDLKNKIWRVTYSG